METFSNGTYQSHTLTLRVHSDLLAEVLDLLYTRELIALPGVSGVHFLVTDVDLSLGPADPVRVTLVPVAPSRLRTGDAHPVTKEFTQ